MMDFPFDGAIFDLDGTLLDTMDMWHEVDKAFFKSKGLELPADYQQAIKGMHFDTAAEYTIKRFSLSESPAEVIAQWNDLSTEKYKNSVELKPGAKELLHSLSRMGKKLSFATASTASLAVPALKRCGVLPLFSAEAYVSEVGKDKSFPDVYLLAAERIGCEPSRCMVFEDVFEAVQGAKSGGFTVCGVYDKSSEDCKEKIKKAADIYIESFYDLI